MRYLAYTCAVVNALVAVYVFTVTDDVTWATMLTALSVYNWWVGRYLCE